MTTAAGWYPSATDGPNAERYWDGQAWSEHVRGGSAGDLYAKGQNGQIAVSGDWLTITRKGLGRVGHSKGDRRIPLANIQAVQMRPAGALANGFIKFTVPGSPESRGGLADAGKDENAVIFTKGHQAEFDALRAHIEGYISKRLNPGVAQAAVPAAPDLADQLGKLAALRDSGVLSEAEFAAQKAKLLA